MALDALRWRVAEFDHKPKHDLESLFYVILNICTYVSAPGRLRGSVAGQDEESVCINEWWATYDYNLIFRSKAIQMSAFDTFILERLPPYWNDFHQVLIDLRNVIWPAQYVLASKNSATHDKFLEVLTKARDVYRDKGEQPLAFAPISNRQASSSSAQKRKGKNIDAAGEAKRSKKLSEATLALTRKPNQLRSSQAPNSNRRTSSRLAPDAPA